MVFSAIPVITSSPSALVKGGAIYKGTGVPYGRIMCHRNGDLNKEYAVCFVSQGGTWNVPILESGNYTFRQLELDANGNTVGKASSAETTTYTVTGSRAVQHTLFIPYNDDSFNVGVIKYSDNNFYDGYYFNAPSSAVPAANLTVIDWPYIKAVIDGWHAKGGDSVNIPVFWDRSQYGPNSFEFRHIIWALNYANSKGMVASLRFLPFRRYEAGYPDFSTTSSWSFEAADREIDSNGQFFTGDTRFQVLALGSPKWANVYNWVAQAAQALSPYKNLISYVTFGTNVTQETSFYMQALNANHPDTVAAWQAWYAQNYGGTAVPAMSLRTDDTVTVTKIRTAKFISHLYRGINKGVAKAFKTVIPEAKFIWHGGSMTDVTFLRGGFTSMQTLPEEVGGVKHNPGGDWDAKFETRAIVKEGHYAIVEWTRVESLVADATAFANKVKVCIDNGASEISYAFFDTFYKDTAINTYLDSIIAILTTDGYWDTNVRPTATTNDDVILFKTSEVAAFSGNKWLDYRNVYTSPFNTSVSNNSGVSPSVEWVDDIDNAVTCDNGSTPFTIISASYNPDTDAVTYVYNAANLTSAIWRVKLNGTVINSGTTTHTSATNTVAVGSLGAGSYVFELSGTSCIGTASIVFTVASTSPATKLYDYNVIEQCSILSTNIQFGCTDGGGVQRWADPVSPAYTEKSIGGVTYKVYVVEFPYVNNTDPTNVSFRDRTNLSNVSNVIANITV